MANQNDYLPPMIPAVVRVLNAANVACVEGDGQSAISSGQGQNLMLSSPCPDPCYIHPYTGQCKCPPW